MIFRSAFNGIATLPLPGLPRRPPPEEVSVVVDEEDGACTEKVAVAAVE